MYTKINGFLDMTHIAVIGASGFIGENLLADLAERRESEVRVLTRSRKVGSQNGSHVFFIEGDLLKPETLDVLFEPGCTVINLAYLASGSKRDNLDAMTNLAEACARKRVKRLIHCSTAVVAGSSKEDWVDESTLCNPVTEYEKTKLEIESVLFEKSLGVFEFTILRPTAVFGPGGKNLLKLAKELEMDSLWSNYARSCLFYRRSMNLVCVENVVAALIFLLDADGKIDREIFIVSDDDAPMNNYRDIETRLLDKLGKHFPVKSVPLPLMFLGVFRQILGKPAVNLTVKYSDKKLASFGFKKPQSLEDGIELFASYYIKHEHPKR